MEERSEEGRVANPYAPFLLSNGINLPHPHLTPANRQPAASWLKMPRPDWRWAASVSLATADIGPD